MRTEILSSIKKGVKQAFPIVLGCVTIGMAYGILAQQTGLDIWSAMGMSLFVFAGSSQFMAVSMIQNGVEASIIISSTLIVNIRHLLMSASVAPYLGRWKTWQRLLLGGMLTDESFILHSLNFERGDSDTTSAIAINSAVYIAWSISGMAGHKLGTMIANPEVWGLDFALPAMFVGLLMSACKDKTGAVAAAIGGTVSVGLHLMNAGNLAAFIATIAGATAGVLFYFYFNSDAKEGARS